MNEKLIELGFELKDYYGNKAYVFTPSNKGDRFRHDFVYYEDESTFYINRYFRRGLETISEIDLIRNHNELNTTAKRTWIEIKETLQDYKFEIAI